MKKTVLVHVISNLGIGGAETVLYHLLRRLDTQQFEHKVIYFYDGPYVQKIRELGIPVYNVKGLFGLYDPVFMVRFFYSLKNYSQIACILCFGQQIFWEELLHGNIRFH